MPAAWHDIAGIYVAGHEVFYILGNTDSDESNKHSLIEDQ